MKKKLKVRRILTVLGLLSSLLWSGLARADVLPTDEEQTPVSKKNVELPESSPGSPPLATDDPGTPGPWGVEINFITNSDFSESGKVISGGIDANLGIGEYLQLRVQKEAVKQILKDEGEHNSLGATSLGVKWRFYDDGNLKMAFYPSYEMNDTVETESEGRSIYLPLILSKTLGSYTMVLNAGVTKNFDFPEKASSFTSIALGHALNETTRLMGEVTSQLAESQRQNDLRVGIVKEIFANENSPYKTGLFASVGESIGPTEDGQAHTSVMLGFTFAKEPKN